MQWMVPHERLGPEQIEVLNRCLQMQKGCLWLQGVAGSGKTVLLVHAIVESLTLDPNLSACVVVYTHALKDLVKTGIPPRFSHVPVMTYFEFLADRIHYDLVVVDEVQDLEADALAQVAKYATKLLVAGDSDQSIYADKVTHEQIETQLSPEKYRLDILYRLTAKLQEIARSILPNTHIETARVARMLSDVDIRLVHAPDIQTEVAWVWRESMRYANATNPSAILLPNHRLTRKFIKLVCESQGKPPPPVIPGERQNYGPVNEHLKQHAINLRYLGSGYGSLAESDECAIVYLMTYHSAKGLDFETVFLPCLDSKTSFWRDDDQLARRLFFVAITRCRRNLIMSYHTQRPHPYIEAMPQRLIHRMECEAVTPQKSETSEPFVFF